MIMSGWWSSGWGNEHYSMFIHVLLQITDDENGKICHNCRQKVHDFDQFYMHIENVHRANLGTPDLPDDSEMGQQTISTDSKSMSNASNIYSQNIRPKTVVEAPVRRKSKRSVRSSFSKTQQKTRKYASNSKPLR